MDTLFKYRDVVVSADENTLIISNSKFSRTFDLSKGFIRTSSLKYGKYEFASADSAQCDFHFIGMNLPHFANHPTKVTDIDCELVSEEMLDSEHVKVSVKLYDDFQQITYVMEYFVYPELALLGCRGNIDSAVSPNVYWSHRGRLSNDMTRGYCALDSVTDSFRYTPNLIPRYTVEFTARTDYTDNVVIHHKIAGDGEYYGNILVLSDSDGKGVAFLQEAPPTAERRDFEKYDFLIQDSQVNSCNWGIAPEELQPGKTFTGYRTVMPFFDDSTDFEFKLKDYLKKRFPANLQQATAVTVNPWGCGKFPSLATKEFLLEEIRSAADVGATTYQIDDGWQTGDGLKELILYNHKMDKEFWSVSERLDHKLDELIEEFRKNNLDPGLWIAPSFNVEFRDWQEFAEIILDFHRKHDICIFKIDGVKIRSYESEENLRKMLAYLRRQSDGRIVFNLDTTNGQRPGYFLFLEFGNIFLENRYVCHMWGLGYHPERTLRNFWKLARYMRSEMLQVEMANPGDINPVFYANKGECLPSVYDLEYWAAVTMFANPLIWMAPSTVSKENRKVINRMMKLHRQEAEKIFAGTVVPVGNMPNGGEFTGFVSVSDNGGELIIYREKDEKNGRAEIVLPHVDGNFVPEIVSGTGICRIEKSIAYVEVPCAPGYLWVKWDK